jgi:pimeloyl-ACP methyl ester carboxylesterase
VTASSRARASTARANGLEFGLLEAGGPGPLALCLHGFPDTAHTWGELLPVLADRLWADWSPGHHPGEHLTRVKESLRQPANLAAAIGYYRAAAAQGTPGAPRLDARDAAEQQAAYRQAPQPTLYLHGANDGCIAADLARHARPLLAPSSRMIVIGDAGHFLHLEKPGEVNNHILTWVTS